MGRHSSPEQGPFFKSFFGWIGLWLMIAVVTGVGLWFVVAAIGGPDATKPIAADASEAKEPKPEPTVSGAVIANEEEQTPTPEPEETQDPPAEKAELITEGVSVQVLNGTLDAAAAQALADELGGLGYTIVAVEESSRAYSQTTVFWSTEAAREAAEALSERFGWQAEPKPANLSDAVSLHVVVGADEA